MQQIFKESSIIDYAKDENPIFLFSFKRDSLVTVKNTKAFEGNSTSNKGFEVFYLIELRIQGLQSSCWEHIIGYSKC
jgi:hypothetical protein